MVAQDREEARTAGEVGCLLRTIWMLLGHAALFMFLLAIERSDSAPISLLSIGFWIVASLVVLARYVDVTRYKGTTSVGDRPATLLDVKRFGTRLAVVAGAGWALAHAL